MQEVISGVLHWQAQHPNIGMNVSSYLLTDTGTALDPLLPNCESPQWLEQPVNRAVLTVRHHLRSAPQLGVPILAHRDELQEFDRRLGVQGFQAGDELAPGIRVLGFGRICPHDTVLHITAGPGVLAFGDGIVNYGVSAIRRTSSSVKTRTP